MKELIKNKVYYKIFDLSFKDSSHIYNKKNNNPKHLEIIKNNRQSITDYYQANNIVILKQIHSTKIIDADLITNFATDLEGDGIVTTKRDLVLAIQTADCVPILLSSKDHLLIGAAHCGWKGAKAGIVNNLLRLMKNKGVKEFYVVIGPSIQQYSYEVNQNFYNNFIDDKANYAKFFIPSCKEKHHMFDLPSYVELHLQEAGINNITKILEDTYITILDEKLDNRHNSVEPIRYKYPSYRRCCHTGEFYNSSILSTIIIKP